MKSHNNNGQEYLMVEVQEGQGDDFEIIRDQDNYDQQQLKFPSDKFNGLQNYSWVNLPAGSWQILFLASEATEEQAGEVVERVVVKPKFVGDKSKTLYYDYGHKFYIMKFATQSLRSLLVHHGMEGETLILKKIV